MEALWVLGGLLAIVIVVAFVIWIFADDDYSDPWDGNFGY